MENDASLSFWTKRLSQHGHTGWADPVIYAYDQAERIKLIRSAVSKLGIKNGTALDFGCGTGDFSKLLIEMGFTVCGYDPFVQPTIHSHNFISAKTYSEIPFGSKSVDLTLTVTALAHILNQEDLEAALTAIRQSTKQHGAVFLVEYALDSEADQERFSLKSDYQVFRTLLEWKHLLEKSSFRVLNVTPIPQPLISPSAGFLAYSRSTPVKIARKLSRFPFPRSLQRALLNSQARKYLRSTLGVANVNGSSPLKFFHCAVT